MKSQLFTAMAALLITVSAGSMADADRLDPGTPGTGTGDNTQADPNPVRAVPGRSYRNQSPPRYRIEQRSGGSSNAFPRVPGTSYRDYSRPGYNTR